MTTHPLIRRTAPRGPLFEVREAFWGYVIRGTEGPPVMLQVAQGLTLAAAAAFTAGALVVVLLPSSPEAQGLGPIRALLSTTLASLALLLMWFATRGGTVELHVDLAQGELREFVRHRIGRATLVGRHGFDGGLSLRLDRSGPDGAPRALVLRLRDEARGRVIARGPEPALLLLRRRLEDDLVLGDRALRRPEPQALGEPA